MAQEAEVFFATTTNVVVSVVLVVVNKLTVAGNFDFMIVLTGLHFYGSFISCLLLLLTGMLHYKAVHNYASLLRIAGASLASIIFMNLNLKYNSVAFYQVSKLLCIPCTILLERIFRLKGTELNFATISSLLFIIAGMLLISEGEIEYDSHMGLIFMGLGVLCTSVAQVFFGPLQASLGLNSLQLLFHTSPWMAFACFLITPICEDTSRLVDFNLTGAVLLALTTSCIMAFLLNISNYKVLEITTPLTYQILGHVKTVGIILVGYLVFGDSPSYRVSSGICCSIFGMLAYGWEKNRVGIQNALLPSGNKKDVRKVRRSLIHVESQALTKRDKRASLVKTEKIRHGSMISWLGADTGECEEDEIAPHEYVPKLSPEVKARNKSEELLANFRLKSDEISRSKHVRPSEAQKLRLYALFKFLENGPCCVPKPGLFDPVGRAKWNAWTEIDKNSHKDDLMKEYISIAEQLLNPSH